MEKELEEFYERISELMEDMNVTEICSHIVLENMRSWLSVWKSEMGRNIDIIWAAVKDADRLLKDNEDDLK